MGDRDFNYREMLDTSQFLKKLSYPHGLQLFSGSHTWPPADEMISAFRFIDLELHKKGKITLSRKDIEEYFKEDILRLSKFKEEKDLIKMAAEYERITVGYSQVRISDSLMTAKRDFFRSSEYKNQKKQEDKAILSEAALQLKLNKQFEKDFDNPTRVKWKKWEKTISELRERSDDPDVDNMHARIYYWLYVKTIPLENPKNSNGTDVQNIFIKKFRNLFQTAV